MKLFSGFLAAGLALLSASAQAQAPHQMRHAPYAPVSDIGSPYAAPYDVPGYVQGQGYDQGYYGQGPALMPLTEVYTVLRESGFSPLGVPRLHGFYYTIAVIDRRGEDGRLIIDARDGRIVRFTPAYRMGRNFNAAPMAVYGPAGTPTPTHASSHVTRASRTVPLPKANPLAARPAAEPVQQAAAPAPKPVEVPAAAPQPVTTGSAPAKPLPQVAPTQDMPNVQGLE